MDHCNGPLPRSVQVLRASRQGSFEPGIENIEIVCTGARNPGDLSDAVDQLKEDLLFP